MVRISNGSGADRLILWTCVTSRPADAVRRLRIGASVGWCESQGLDPLVGIQRAHVELDIRCLGEGGLLDSSVSR